METRVVSLIATTALFAFSTVFVPSASADDHRDCDRTGDHRVTAIDALSALVEAVSPCLKDEICDANNDEELTAVDAMLLLQFAVDIPVALDCNCLFIDECFGDDDCIGFYPDVAYCHGTLCSACGVNEDCEEGEVCDRNCLLRCVPAP